MYRYIMSVPLWAPTPIVHNALKKLCSDVRHSDQSCREEKWENSQQENCKQDEAVTRRRQEGSLSHLASFQPLWFQNTTENICKSRELNTLLVVPVTASG
ncbi:hypothetical protein ISCGN_019536 [Ixodes scapularis]